MGVVHLPIVFGGLKVVFDPQTDEHKPLAERVRPKTLDDLVGQQHVMGKDGILRKALEKGSIFSCILYGPPGCGKSSIAELIKKIRQC